MLFEFSDEHDELRRTVRDFLEKESDESRVRELMADEAGFDPALWSRMAEELGIVGLVVDEEHGGAGLGNVELAIVMEEMGRALLCAPYLSSAVLARGHRSRAKYWITLSRTVAPIGCGWRRGYRQMCLSMGRSRCG